MLAFHIVLIGLMLTSGGQAVAARGRTLAVSMQVNQHFVIDRSDVNLAAVNEVHVSCLPSPLALPVCEIRELGQGKARFGLHPAWEYLSPEQLKREEKQMRVPLDVEAENDFAEVINYLLLYRSQQICEEVVFTEPFLDSQIDSDREDRYRVTLYPGQVVNVGLDGAEDGFFNVPAMGQAAVSCHHPKELRQKVFGCQIRREGFWNHVVALYVDRKKVQYWDSWFESTTSKEHKAGILLNELRQIGLCHRID